MDRIRPLLSVTKSSLNSYNSIDLAVRIEYRTAAMRSELVEVLLSSNRCQNWSDPTWPGTRNWNAHYRVGNREGLSRRPDMCLQGISQEQVTLDYGKVIC